MSKHSHEFVNTHNTELIAFGVDRETDEQSLRAYLQMFTDDELLAALVPRLSDEEIVATLDFAGALLRKHLSEDEYHSLFLKDESHG